MLQPFHTCLFCNRNSGSFQCMVDVFHGYFLENALKKGECCIIWLFCPGEKHSNGVVLLFTPEQEQHCTKARQTPFYLVQCRFSSLVWWMSISISIYRLSFEIIFLGVSSLRSIRSIATKHGASLAGYGFCHRFSWFEQCAWLVKTYSMGGTVRRSIAP